MHYAGYLAVGGCGCLRWETGGFSGQGLRLFVVVIDLWVFINDVVVGVVRSCKGVEWGPHLGGAAMAKAIRGEQRTRVWLLEEDDVAKIEGHVKAAEGKYGR